MALMTRVIISIVLDMMMGAVMLCMWKEVGCIDYDSVMVRLGWHTYTDGTLCTGDSPVRVGQL
jgi:hypothetical protein